MCEQGVEAPSSCKRLERKRKGLWDVINLSSLFGPDEGQGVADSQVARRTTGEE